MSEHEVSPDRRDFLLGLLSMPVLAAAGTASFLSPISARAATPTYIPTYFNEAEWAFLNAAAERLIPSDENGPGAREAGVPEFIDRQMETDYGHGGRWYLQGPFNPNAPDTLGYQLQFTPREFYRAAVADINLWCRQTHGADFASLSPGVQDEVLRVLEKGEVDLPNIKASEFFNQFLGNTKEGYFADPMYGGNRGMGGWKMIGFPGARADFMDWSRKPGVAYPLGPVSILGEKA